MFEKIGIGNWIVALAILGCSQPPPVKEKVVKLPIRVAIIDTGVDPSFGGRLCVRGHHDFIRENNDIGYDYNGHGTSVAKTIADYSDGNYCLIIYKVVEGSKFSSPETLAAAIDAAVDSGARLINISLNSNSISSYNKEEHDSLKRAVDAGVKVFVAAGNNRVDLDKRCSSFPACYKDIKITVVGSKEHRLNLSNYGKIVDVTESFCYNKFCGTSASTAIATGKAVKEMNK